MLLVMVNVNPQLSLGGEKARSISCSSCRWMRRKALRQSLRKGKAPVAKAVSPSEEKKLAAPSEEKKASSRAISLMDVCRLDTPLVKRVPNKSHTFLRSNIPPS